MYSLENLKKNYDHGPQTQKWKGNTLIIYLVLTKLGAGNITQSINHLPNGLKATGRRRIKSRKFSLRNNLVQKIY